MENFLQSKFDTLSHTNQFSFASIHIHTYKTQIFTIKLSHLDWIVGIKKSKCFWHNWIYSTFVQCALSIFHLQFPTNFTDRSFLICGDRKKLTSNGFSHALVSSSIYEIAISKSKHILYVSSAYFTFVFNIRLINLPFTLWCDVVGVIEYRIASHSI